LALYFGIFLIISLALFIDSIFCALFISKANKIKSCANFKNIPHFSINISLYFSISNSFFNTSLSDKGFKFYILTKNASNKTLQKWLPEISYSFLNLFFC